MNSNNFLIIGGGPNGLLTAIELAKNGYQSTIIEKHPTDIRRGYVHSKPIKNVIHKIIQDLEDKGIAYVQKYNRRLVDKKQNIPLNNIQKRLKTQDEEFLVQIKEMQSIFHYYIDQFYSDKINIIKDHDLNPKNIVCNEKESFYNLEDKKINFDHIINASGWHPEFYKNLVSHVSVNSGDSESLFREYQLSDKCKHATIMMHHFGEEKDLIEEIAYNHEALQQELQDLGYKTPVNFKTIDCIEKKSDFIEDNPKCVIVVLKLPYKNKVLVVGPMPENINQENKHELTEKIAQTILKYKFPNNQFALDLQDLNKRLARLQSSNAKEEKVNKLKQKILNSSQEVLSRKQKKDELTQNLFQINCCHLKNPVYSINKNSSIINLGDSLFTPFYPNGEGMFNGIECSKNLISSLKSDDFQNDMNQKMKNYIRDNIEDKIKSQIIVR